MADLAKSAVNIAYGTYYLRYLLDEYHGNLTLASAVHLPGYQRRSVGGGPHARGTVFTVDDIPFSGTRAYVQRVLTAERGLPEQIRGAVGMRPALKTTRAPPKQRPRTVKSPGWSVTA